MREDEEILKIGKHEIDVSNISLHKKMIATAKWNKANGIVCHRDGTPKKDDEGKILSKQRNLTEIQFQNEILGIGLFLIRQEYKVLRRNNSFIDTIKQIIKRALITRRYINSLTSKDVEIIVTWIFEYLTGKKKATANIVEKSMELIDKMTGGMTDKEQQQFTTFVMTSLSDLIGQWQKSTAIPKVK